MRSAMLYVRLPNEFVSVMPVAGSMLVDCWLWVQNAVFVWMCDRSIAAFSTLYVTSVSITPRINARLTHRDTSDGWLLPDLSATI